MNTAPDPPTPRDISWFENLYATHYREVYAFCRRRLPAAAEDLSADVFATVWAKREVVPTGSPLPWIFGVAHNKIHTERRTRGRRAKLDQRVASEPTVTNDDPAATVPKAISRTTETARVLNALDSKDREVLRLWAWEELDLIGIATVLGISHTAARARLSRAKKRAAKALGNNQDNIVSLFSA